MNAQKRRVVRICQQGNGNKRGEQAILVLDPFARISARVGEPMDRTKQATGGRLCGPRTSGGDHTAYPEALIPQT